MSRYLQTVGALYSVLCTLYDAPCLYDARACMMLVLVCQPVTLPCILTISDGLDFQDGLRVVWHAHVSRVTRRVLFAIFLFSRSGAVT